MIPSNSESLKKLEALAERNIANGDWGDESTFPGDELPSSPEEQVGKSAAMKVLSKHGSASVPKKRG